ncbi:MAG: triose-phosphate isomerase [Desulfobacteraceae bacterium]|nr:triose-phosphate isomerase [Desulfobacteraceae bacterium]
MADRLPLIAANWKMFKRIDEAVVFIGALHHEVGRPTDREVVIAPPFTALAAVSAAMRDTAFKLAAQNFHYEEKGAFTGEISGVMLKEVDCEYVILGHSERRHVFGEEDELIRKKVAAAFRYGFTPIFCVGEKLEKREEGKTFEVVGKQLKQGLEGLSAEQAAQVVVAYEPVWAIGTGKTATPEQAQEVHAFIRECYSSLFDIGVANRVRIVYGGSVKPDNVDTLMAQPDIDGMLVGGASLEVASFKRIVQFQ